MQTKDNGPIEYSRELPNDCRLSAGLKKIIIPLLAGLLEADPKRIWTFDRFFAEVTNILSCKIIHVFHVNRVMSLKAYVHPDDTYEQLQNYIKEQTEIAPDAQILLYENGLFVDLVGEGTRAQGYPDVKEGNPLFLYSRENNNITVVNFGDLPKFPEFPSLTSVDNDAAQAKLACSIGHLCKRRIEVASTASELIQKAVRSFIEYVVDKLRELEVTCSHLLEMTQARKDTMRALELSSSLAIALFNGDEKFSVSSYVKELKGMSDPFINEANLKVTQLFQRNVKEDMLNLEWNSLSKGIKTPFHIGAAARAQTQVERLRDSWQHLYRDRATRSLSYNDEQFHALEKIKTTETGRRLKTLLEVECIPPFTQLAEVLGDWYKIAQTVYLQTMILHKDVLEYRGKLDNFAESLTLEMVQYSEDVKVSLQANKNCLKVHSSMNNKKVLQNNGKLKNSLKEAGQLSKEIMNIIKDYGELVEQFNKLSVSKITADVETNEKNG